MPLILLLVRAYCAAPLFGRGAGEVWSSVERLPLRHSRLLGPSGPAQLTMVLFYPPHVRFLEIRVDECVTYDHAIL